jgi:D-glycero-alpha-D-manno-heptose 1-phosphate guanylyltransferase
MDAIVLCGGGGTRLKSVVDKVPKPLAEVLGRPFLNRVLDYLARSGFVDRVILATGHLAETIEAQYGEGYGCLRIEYSRELQPLGTGGAVLLALKNFRLSSPFLLLNGDSFLDFELPRLIAEWERNPDSIVLSLYPCADCSRFGVVELEGSRVARFIEKTGQEEYGLINAGIYLLREDVLDPWKRSDEAAVSLERDVLPRLTGAGKVLGVPTGTCFIDIGLPETYRAASAFFADFEAAGKAL